LTRAWLTDDLTDDLTNDLAKIQKSLFHKFPRQIIAKNSGKSKEKG
jgi:hypothetical protein